MSASGDSGAAIERLAGSIRAVAAKRFLKAAGRPWADYAHAFARPENRVSEALEEAADREAGIARRAIGALVALADDVEQAERRLWSDILSSASRLPRARDDLTAMAERLSRLCAPRSKSPRETVTNVLRGYHLARVGVVEGPQLMTPKWRAGIDQQLAQQNVPKGERAELREICRTALPVPPWSPLVLASIHLLAYGGAARELALQHSKRKAAAVFEIEVETFARMIKPMATEVRP